jgi:hypothetical protein
MRPTPGGTPACRSPDASSATPRDVRPPRRQCARPHSQESASVRQSESMPHLAGGVPPRAERLAPRTLVVPTERALTAPTTFLFIWEMDVSASFEVSLTILRNSATEHPTWNGTCARARHHREERAAPRRAAPRRAAPRPSVVRLRIAIANGGAVCAAPQRHFVELPPGGPAWTKANVGNGSDWMATAPPAALRPAAVCVGGAALHQCSRAALVSIAQCSGDGVHAAAPKPNGPSMEGRAS